MEETKDGQVLAELESAARVYIDVSEEENLPFSCNITSLKKPDEGHQTRPQPRTHQRWPNREHGEREIHAPWLQDPPRYRRTYQRFEGLRSRQVPRPTAMDRRERARLQDSELQRAGRSLHTPKSSRHPTVGTMPGPTAIES